MKKERAKAEYGDFQTPPDLAKHVCSLLAKRSFRPQTIIEPTCGLGHLLFAAVDEFPTARRALAVDVNPSYVAAVETEIARRKPAASVEAVRADFFHFDWQGKLRDLPEPLLVIGNPPWVTNSELGALESENLPHKSNFQGRSGLDALTGKSNFDISEWMLLRMFDWLVGKQATLAVLCKTAVARKVLAQMWKRGAALGSAAIYSIDAEMHFKAAVDASLFTIDFAAPQATYEACVFDDLNEDRQISTIGWREGQLVADMAGFRDTMHLRGKSPFKWRSGVKHDCSKVMELRKEGESFRNGLGEVVALEERFLYSMHKSSELGSGRRRWMLVTQEAVGDSTAAIARLAPLTWDYLASHAELLNARRSSIYKGRPPYSVFGVGPYTFAPWKVAISGFYKQLEFSVVGPHGGKPTVLDDTCYFLPFTTQPQAEFIAGLLNSPAVRRFFKSIIFWDAKRPITVDVLKQLDLRKAALELGAESTWLEFWPDAGKDRATQGRLFV